MLHYLHLVTQCLASKTGDTASYIYIYFSQHLLNLLHFPIYSFLLFSCSESMICDTSHFYFVINDKRRTLESRRRCRSYLKASTYFLVIHYQSFFKIDKKKELNNNMNDMNKKKLTIGHVLLSVQHAPLA